MIEPLRLMGDVTRIGHCNSSLNTLSRKLVSTYSAEETSEVRRSEQRIAPPCITLTRHESIICVRRTPPHPVTLHQHAQLSCSKMFCYLYTLPDLTDQPHSLESQSHIPCISNTPLIPESQQTSAPKAFSTDAAAIYSPLKTAASFLTTCPIPQPLNSYLPFPIRKALRLSPTSLSMEATWGV